MSTNPSHILIARSSRGLSSPAAALSSPTETHAAAAGIFRSGAPSGSHRRGHRHNSDNSTSTGSVPWFMESDSDDCGTSARGSSEGGGGLAGGSDEVELDPTFTRQGRFPGTVKIVVESTTFWAHREILVFASPFFEAALSGEWSETTKPIPIDDDDSDSETAARRQSISSVITISQLPSSNSSASATAVAEMMFATPENVEHADDELDTDVDDLHSELESLGEKERKQKSIEKGKDVERKETLRKLSGSLNGQPTALSPRNARGKKRNTGPIPDAVVVLKEEKASIFHDFLKFVYPHLECSITWNNVEGLMNIGSKLCVPTLTQQCLAFLLTHAAGKPIKAMRIAELFQEEQLYRESSRFVLDNPGGWSENELSTLSQETLLKLEKRRNWFLERVLKLGTITIAKEYQCCPTCPDSATCARLLDEKWRQAYNACFRFGPCQPSMVYRYLRGLEGVTPPLALTHLSCQTMAKNFTITLFDRMFALGVRGSGTGADPQPVANRPGAVPSPAPGPRRHFLYCSLKS